MSNAKRVCTRALSVEESKEIQRMKRWLCVFSAFLPLWVSFTDCSFAHIGRGTICLMACFADMRVLLAVFRVFRSVIQSSLGRQNIWLFVVES